MAPVTEMQENTNVQVEEVIEEVIEENNGAAGSGDVAQEIPVRAILGQTSGVDALRGRLKELRGSESRKRRCTAPSSGFGSDL